MSKKKGKGISFDAMVKFFMQNYNIPTKKDVDRIIAKLDRLENLIMASMASGGARLPARYCRGGGDASGRATSRPHSMWVAGCALSPP